MKDPTKKTSAGAITLLADAQLREVSGAGIGSGGKARLHELDVTRSTDKATPKLF